VNAVLVVAKAGQKAYPAPLLGEPANAVPARAGQKPMPKVDQLMSPFGILVVLLLAVHQRR